MNLAWSFRACLAFQSSFLLTVLPHLPARSLRVPLAWPSFMPRNRLTKRQDSPQNFSISFQHDPSSRSSFTGLLLFHFTDPQGIFRGDLFQAGQCLFFSGRFLLNLGSPGEKAHESLLAEPEFRHDARGGREAALSALAFTQENPHLLERQILLLGWLLV